MRKLLLFIIVVGLLIAGAWAMGWITVNNTSTTTIISVDKGKASDDMSNAGTKMKEGVDKAVEKGKELGSKAVEKTKETVQDVKDKVNEKKETTTTTTTTTEKP